MASCNKIAKKRCANWTDKEKATAIGLIVEEEGRGLFSAFRGASLGANDKKQMWENISQRLNASGLCVERRSVEDIKSMFKNSKSLVKAKLDAAKKTGSGPIKLSPAEEILADHLRDVNPRQIDGIPGGVETYVTVSSVPEVYMPSTPTEDVTAMPLVFSMSAVHETASSDQPQPPVSCPGTSEACAPAEALDNSFVYDSQSNTYQIVMDCASGSTVGKTDFQKGKTTSRKRKGLSEERLFALEEKRLLAEIRAYDSQHLFYQNKIKKDNEIHDLNKKLLLKRINEE